MEDGAGPGNNSLSPLGFQFWPWDHGVTCVMFSGFPGLWLCSGSLVPILHLAFVQFSSLIHELALLVICPGLIQLTILTGSWKQTRQ